MCPNLETDSELIRKRIQAGELRKFLNPPQAIEYSMEFFLTQRKGIAINEVNYVSPLFSSEVNQKFEQVPFVLYPIFEFLNKKELLTRHERNFIDLAFQSTLALILQDTIPKAMLTKHKNNEDVGDFFHYIASPKASVDRLQKWISYHDPKQKIFAKDIHDSLASGELDKGKIYWWGNSIFNTQNNIIWMQHSLLGASKNYETYRFSSLVNRKIIKDLFLWEIIKNGTPESVFQNLKYRFVKYRSNFGTPYLKKMKPRDQKRLKKQLKDSFPYEYRLIEKMPSQKI